jgi:hypothetical protein
MYSFLYDTYYVLFYDPASVAEFTERQTWEMMNGG